MDHAETALTPRCAALIAALHAAKGDRQAAEMWMMELIAWIVFRQRPAASPQTSSLPAQEAHL